MNENNIKRKAFHYSILSSLFLIFLICFGCQSVQNESNQKDVFGMNTSVSDAPKVTLLGVFHFGGSTGDLASMHLSNPFGNRRQREINELISQLAEFKPTKILVEYPKSKQDRLDESYNNYLLEKDTLSVNETQQIGFRLAKQFGHNKLYAIDYQMNLPAEGMVEYCQKHNKMDEFQAFIKGIHEYVAAENQVLDTLSISSYLSRINDDVVDRLTNETYIGNTLNWGDSTNEGGARFAAAWWERNFVILKNIAHTIENNEDRILVIIGAGHRAVLKDLIDDRSDMEYVEIGEYLN